MTALRLHSRATLIEVDDQAVLYIPWQFRSLALNPTAAAVVDCFSEPCDPVTIINELISEIGLEADLAVGTVEYVVEMLMSVGALTFDEVEPDWDVVGRFPLPPST